MNNVQPLLSTIVPAVLILAAPLGVAGQNIGIGFATLAFVIFCFNDRARSLKSALKNPLVLRYLILWMLVILPIFVATIARGDFKEAARFILGYSLVLPLLVISLTLSHAPLNKSFIIKFSSIILSIVAVVALSQILIGWQITESQVTSQIRRAQGFYSHPLTLAYSALLIMPLTVARLIAKPKELISQALAVSIIIIVIASQSVTVIALTILTSAILCLRLLKPAQLGIVAILAAIVGTSAVTIPNPIANKFQTVMHGQRGDHETPYMDDRMAFWHAHWEMLKDAPVTGHGSGISREMRKPYYEKIGLGEIKRMYEAHNMYLQYAVEGGVLSAIGFFAFLIWWFLKMRSSTAIEPWLHWALVLTPLTFALGGLTQNAIQDSEVRYMCLLICALSFFKTAGNEI